MKKVKDTKTPTVRQLQNISENLKCHFETYVSVSIKTYSHYLTDSSDIGYGIYIAIGTGAGDSFEFGTWAELLQCYHELMKGELI